MVVIGPGAGMNQKVPTEADTEIAKAIEAGNSFLVDAGAGSGKTSSLVAALLLLKDKCRDRLVKNRQHIACITYTNVAKNEIIERTEGDELFSVSTIHDFLWAQCKGFPDELKMALIAYNRTLKENSRRKVAEQDLVTALSHIGRLSYSEYGSRYAEGRISHDEVIALSEIMFGSHKRLARLTGATYPFIFVDEYQDTAPSVVNILLDAIRPAAPETLIGFFGDKAQSIYDDGVGELSEEHQRQLTQIKKGENFRCAKSVIGVLNRFRTDIEQFPAGTNVEGKAVYVGLSGKALPENGYQLASTKLEDAPEFEDPERCKVLFLTHRLIARRGGYESLYRAFDKYGGFARDDFVKGEHPVAVCLAFDVDRVAERWANAQVGDVLNDLTKGGFDLKSIAHKKETGEVLTQLSEMIRAGESIGEVVAHVRSKQLLRLHDRLVDGLDLIEMAEDEVTDEDKRKWTFFRDLAEVPMLEVRAYRNFLLEHTAYSTKHGVKGDEFDTVIVVLDDAGARWNKYAFGKCLSGDDANKDRVLRTQNLLYVCMSRAKRNLVVVDLGYEPDRLPVVQTLFGQENVIIK